MNTNPPDQPAGTFPPDEKYTPSIATGGSGPSEEAMTLARLNATPTEENYRLYALMIDSLISNKTASLLDLLNEAYVFITTHHRIHGPWRNALDAWQAKVETRTGWNAFAELEKRRKLTPPTDNPGTNLPQSCKWCGSTNIHSDWCEGQRPKTPTTPETDVNSRDWDRANRPGCDADFARKLEVERDALRVEVERLFHANADLSVKLDAAVKERGNLRAELIEANKDRWAGAVCKAGAPMEYAELAKENEELKVQLKDMTDQFFKVSQELAAARDMIEKKDDELANICACAWEDEFEEDAPDVIEWMQARAADALALTVPNAPIATPANKESAS